MKHMYQQINTFDSKLITLLSTTLNVPTYQVHFFLIPLHADFALKILILHEEQGREMKKQ